MGVPPDSSPFGSQTVTGPGWPNVDEESLAAAAAQYEALAAKITGSVVPQQQGQMMQMADQWTGAGSLAAGGEATTIVAGHEANAAQAAAIALKLRTMEATVAKTKMLVNTTAQEVQQECEALSAMPFGNAQELVQSRIKMGLSQNIAMVNANSAELASGLGVPPNIPNPGAPPGTAQASQAADKGSQQAMQMMMQMGQMAMQLPQQIGGMLTQAPQQLMQPLQQIMQPLQQLMSAGGKGSSGAGSVSPFSAFSNHPLAGGGGAGAGGGMVKAAGLPGSGGLSPQSPALASLVGSSGDVAVRPAGASGVGVAGLAPVGAGAGGMGGGMGMMGQQRGESGGTGSSLTAPPPLDYGEEEVDDDW
ncbi:hypothetical protein H7K45_00230 [Mycobacterium yunnanensis]|uniref:PPE family protein n=1 Tax=Mycobacterium yunnanensis TaxID=368477 RepID=A0A9X2YWE8_9MYCO|nr:hypothetical protein [Mycobacterium yunnanensis]MCV7418961.1 hypothetical protein [Mycobacterium yunnanensis]